MVVIGQNCVAIDFCLEFVLRLANLFFYDLFCPWFLKIVESGSGFAGDEIDIAGEVNVAHRKN